MSSCTACHADNRDIARFCKRCGKALEAPKADTLLGGLVGLDSIRKVLLEFEQTIEGMRLAGLQPCLPFSTLIIGDSGTAKSRLGALIAQVFASLNLTKQAAPVIVNALQADELESKRLQSQMEAAKGGVLLIDNAHKLVDDKGDPLPPFNQLMQRIELSPCDPVVVFAGLPYGLKEFVDKAEHRNLVGRIQNVFRIPDYDPEMLARIAIEQLYRHGFSLDDEMREQIVMRMRWLYRRIKSGDVSIRSINGRLALDEAKAIESAYYRRQVTDRVLVLTDIQGEVERRKPIEEILSELNGFVGMTSLKQEVVMLHKDIETSRLRQKLGIGGGDDSQHAYHFTLTGNPGTGKTTIARVLGEVFEALGVLPSGHVVEVDRSKLVGEWQGHTATKVNAVCDQAIGGILFVDEAYALKQGSNDSFGQEAIDTLLKRMEDDRGKYVVIAAGYRNEIQEFLNSNPGLQSRFQRAFHLNDYTPTELTEILEKLAEKEKLCLRAGAHEQVLAFFEDRCARKTKDFANGREARNLLARIKRAQAERLRQSEGLPDMASLTTLEAADVPGVRTGSGESLDLIMAELDAMIGLGNVKEAVRDLQASLQRGRALKLSKPLAQHFLFTGNPGTGKTTVARVLARVFHALGMLPTDKLVEVDRSNLVGQYQGDTAKLTARVCDDALGGVLFIDEAYALKKDGQDSFGQEAIDTLLKRMEDDRGKFVVIAAGYTKEMQIFLDSNSGMRSRFTDIIEFPDYTPEEMWRIFAALAVADSVHFKDDFSAALQAYFKELHARRQPGFANGRTVRQAFEKLCRAQSRRVQELNLSGEELRSALLELTVADLVAIGMVRAESASKQGTALAGLDKLVGLKGVKDAVRELEASLLRERVLGSKRLLARHFIFTGNPGTGKTTVARILAGVFHELGLLPSDRLIETDRGALVGQYVGHTARQVHAVCDQALGGVLFIDEAYALKQGQGDSFGQEAIDTLLKRMEDDRGRFVVIAAGYNREMQSFLNANSGLRSRFSDFIDFADYTPEEMLQIFTGMLAADGLSLAEEAYPLLRSYLNVLYDGRDEHFANGRSVRQVFDQVCRASAMRVSALGLQDDALRLALRELTLADVQALHGL
ncbi:AAA family ATPase [Niveibacterium terrae]|uniref:AAA family ATPase n=1 Tax=Niveibacterium terrae TaxID=3373598 RepID=UPI003A8E03C3